MALKKVTYKEKKTVISAENLNDIQDEVIANQQAIEALQNQVETQNATIVIAGVE